MLQINTEDIRLVTQPIVNTKVKIDVYDERNMNHLEQWECGIISATFSISAESDCRRTATIVCVPEKNKRIRLKKDSIIWINRIIKLQLGIKNLRTGEYTYYKMGSFIFSDYGATYNATENTISLNLNDFWCNLDGSRNGQVGGAMEIKFPAYEEDPNTSEVIKYNYIRDAVITILTQFGKLKESQLEIDDIGEFKGLEQYNPDYVQYREESKVKVKDGTYMETWNAIPFTQEFSCSDTVATMLIAFRDLYPNYEMYFDESGNFVCKMIPSCYYDDIIFDSKFFDRIYISENTSVDLLSVRNICEVWGKVIETDFYTEKCTYSNNCYSATVAGYEEKYYNGDSIAVMIPKENEAGCVLNVNKFGQIPILDENTEKPIAKKILEPNQVYVFKIKKKHIDGSDVTIAYLLGQYQPHAVDILTNGNLNNEDYIAQDGTVIKKYSKEYFQKIYNCKTVNFTVIKDSPFSIEELGLLLCVKTGGEFENITSDSLALTRAEYENWKNSRLTDSITVTTRLVPFADVNIKVSYRRDDTGEINQYIVKNLSHDPSAGTTTWTLMRFYPLYMDEELNRAGTWETASKYTWSELSNYKWDDFNKK